MSGFGSDVASVAEGAVAREVVGGRKRPFWLQSLAHTLARCGAVADTYPRIPSRASAFSPFATAPQHYQPLRARPLVSGPRPRGLSRQRGFPAASWTPSECGNRSGTISGVVSTGARLGGGSEQSDEIASGSEKTE